MQKFLILALCVAAASASVNPFSVSAASIFTPKGVVDPTYRCGGVATFLELRIEGCEGKCFLQPGKTVAIASDIIPAMAAKTLSLRVTAEVFGSESPIMNIELPNSSVQPGQQYTVTFNLTPNDILSGREVTINAYITDTDTERLELCLMTVVHIN